jgi:hypothetical protein
MTLSSRCSTTWRFVASPAMDLFATAGEDRLNSSRHARRLSGASSDGHSRPSWSATGMGEKASPDVESGGQLAASRMVKPCPARHDGRRVHRGYSQLLKTALTGLAPDALGHPDSRRMVRNKPSRTPHLNGGCDQTTRDPSSRKRSPSDIASSPNDTRRRRRTTTAPGEGNKHAQLARLAGSPKCSARILVWSMCEGGL